ncbi:YggT family protein [Henriciella mobilis]|uniref:YggT family protein n=1 Tax=Henriciella mobilis TaxID=2305467 RepID=A0A399RRD0_9PROT|nr:YggT family protein [Henriciella mobilis]RIJ13874.1 YggT family protein [Henriciella mobilis]RIJ20916.1 YggT family protein [Henriciella mobilis]RIJ32903.1 YggT family protein [Henriciella mobilis]
MRALLDIVLLVLQLGIWVLIAQAILSWLIAFNVVNMRNQFVSGLWNVLHQVTEPFCRPIRNLLPRMSGLDLSPLILILIIIFLERVIIYYVYPAVI